MSCPLGDAPSPAPPEPHSAGSALSVRWRPLDKLAATGMGLSLLALADRSSGRVIAPNTRLRGRLVTRCVSAPRIHTSQGPKPPLTSGGSQVHNVGDRAPRAGDCVEGTSSGAS